MMKGIMEEAEERAENGNLAGIIGLLTLRIADDIAKEGENDNHN